MPSASRLLTTGPLIARARHRRPREILVFGVPVTADVSWLFGLGLATWTFADGMLPGAAPGRTAAVYWTAAALVALGVFLSIGLHEAAHCVAARRLGIRTERIVLTLFGGAARLRSSPAAGLEFKIAAAGPLASLALAGAAAVLHVILVEVGADPLVSAGAALLAAVNVFVALLNLVPGLPLDGGRMLCAILVGLTGRRSQAARIATASGRLVGGGLVALATIGSASGDNALALWTGLLGLVILLHPGEEAREAVRVPSSRRRAA